VHIFDRWIAPDANVLFPFQMLSFAELWSYVNRTLQMQLALRMSSAHQGEGLADGVMAVESFK
jgi:hypothetical protein